ncbi:WXG100 family type VII secretion target [Streptosporangium album]|uniref:WXG100 family type VII secretion target n=1 Tax=Streptosporangium album TaxID=47479 RepID=A0A7W7W7B5_9ACTN|nr:WXG100 family type VII secretion target [Streptosporangium album]MBB4937137.1 WXG100 family type VII secretion target [Streptosporangium album]
MSFYTATPSQLTKAASHVEAAARHIKGLQQGTATAVAELTSSGGGWESGAGSKFASVMREWDTQFTKVLQSMEEMYDKLNINANVYSAAEADSHNLNLGEGSVDGARNDVGDGQRSIDSLINGTGR